MADLDPDTELTAEIVTVKERLSERLANVSSMTDLDLAIGSAVGELVVLAGRLSEEVDNLYDVLAELQAKVDGDGLV